MADETKTLTLSQKLFEIQNELGTLAKTKENTFLKGAKYFDINAVIAHLKPLLEKHKLLVMQPLCMINDKPGIRTVITDIESKETEKFQTTYPEVTDAQRAGSSITYFRRYSLVSLFLLEAEDDDGKKAIQKDKVLDIVPLLEKIGACKNVDELKAVWKKLKPKERENEELNNAMAQVKSKLTTIQTEEPK